MECKIPTDKLILFTLTPILSTMRSNLLTVLLKGRNVLMGLQKNPSSKPSRM